MNDIQDILEYYSPEEQTQIREAYDLASKMLKDKYRENGHPFIEHPLGVARIVAAEVGLQYDAVIAIFIHETTRFHPEVVTPQFIKKCKPEILDIAINLNKISAINPRDTRLEADVYKGLIVSLSKDPRVTLIKLSDRLEVMRNLDLLSRSSQEKKVIETSLLYIPLAHQLGLYRLKGELEELCFKFNEPANYRMVSNMLKATEAQREAFTKSFIEPVKQNLVQAGIKFTFKSRTKTAFSIWKKMQKQNIPFEEVYDVFAIRIIIDAPADDREKEVDLCWNAYSIVSKEYETDPDRLRDWLTHPKKNGYESLHTTMSDKKGNKVEVQIRTRRMDAIAENGLASHWSYKGIKEEKNLTQWLCQIRKALESKEKNDYIQALENYNSDIFVFTKDGDLKRLRAGACVLDFAFAIHSNLGCRCTGAIIKGKAVPIREKLHTGDIVEIMSNKNQRPSPDWLNIVVTSKAKNKIKQKIREDELRRVNIGKELLSRRLKNWKLEINDEDLGILRKKYRYDTINNFFSDIGEGKIELCEIKDFLNARKERLPGRERQPGRSVPSPAETAGSPSPHSSSKARSDKGGDSDFIVIDGNLSNVSYKMARCCNPIPGDEVFAFVTVNNGITIHRASCPNASRLIERYPYRIKPVKWKNDSQSSSFQTTLKINLGDASPFAAILNIVNEFGISLRSSNLTPREGKKKGEFVAYIQIFVSNSLQLDKIISAIAKTKGVKSIQRGN